MDEFTSWSLIVGLGVSSLANLIAFWPRGPKKPKPPPAELFRAGPFFVTPEVNIFAVYRDSESGPVWVEEWDTYEYAIYRTGKLKSEESEAASR